MIIISGESPINLENMLFIAKDDAKEIDKYPYAIVYLTPTLGPKIGKKIEATIYFQEKRKRDDYLIGLWQEKLNKK